MDAQEAERCGLVSRSVPGLSWWINSAHGTEDRQLSLPIVMMTSR